MRQVLAVVLVLIALKIFLEAAGFEVPLSAFLGVLLAWRLLAVAWGLARRRRARPPITGWHTRPSSLTREPRARPR